MKHIIVLALLIVVLPFLGAQEQKTLNTSSESQPNPINLTDNWENYFQDKNENFEERLQNYATFLQQTVKDLPPQQQATIQADLNRVQSQLEALIKIHRTPQLEMPNAVPVDEHYSLQQTLDIHRNLRLKANELGSLADEIKEKVILLDANQDKFNQLRREYDQSTPQTISKLDLGFQLISSELELEVTKNDIDLLNQQSTINEEIIDQLEDQLEFALKHLWITQQEIEGFQRQAFETKTHWQQAQRQLKDQETHSSLNRADGEENGNGRANPLSNRNLFRAQITEALTHQKFLIAQEELLLAQVVSESSSLNYNAVNQTVNEWQLLLDNLNIQTQRWMVTAQKQLQRALQTLSRNKISQESSEVIQNQENVLTDVEDILVLIQQFEYENEEARFLFNQINQHLTMRIGKGTKWWWDTLAFFRQALVATNDWLNEGVITLDSKVITPLNILRFIAIFLFALWLSRLALRVLTSIAQRHKAIQRPLMYRISRLIQYAILGIGLVFALSSLGFDLSNFLLIAGALGVGLGFGLQAIFNNFISGVILLFESEIRLGDFIELESGARGEIKEINFRSTLVRTNDGTDIIVPNTQMITSRIINWTLNDPYRRLHVPFTVAYGTDIDFIRQLLADAAKLEPITVKRNKPEPTVFLTKFGDRGYEMELVVWINEKSLTQQRSAVSHYLWLIQKLLNQHQIKIPSL